MQQEVSHSQLAHQTQKKSFTPYQRKESSKRMNPFILDESRKFERQPYKAFKTENSFVLVPPPEKQIQYNPYASVQNFNPLQALMIQNELMALQLQKEFHQQRLYNQVQNLMLLQRNLQLSSSMMMKPSFVEEEAKLEAKKIESPSKVIIIDDCHSDSAETNITDGFYSPTIHITCEEQELEGEQFLERRPSSGPKDQTASIPKFSLNRRTDNLKKRNLKLRWNPETLDRTKLENFMEELGKILRRRISNEQTVIAILDFFDMDTEKALSTIKRNKPEYQNLFNISSRNTRRTIHC